ncbi:diaminopimelate decarboxylase [Microtetraspora sp. NBRC 13810]|uniref:alanine racemase n=1 Tax=Microtetraspora sp. NBRC 13810 TaxID=3030990 RepID=UPI0024A55E21|nr:alanine racemase [Microtetraspora sp. NBRC 13810]GLW05526.1 diaminopimelate decarboxylase [Microtetraspora sp. NBRC 13810]
MSVEAVVPAGVRERVAELVKAGETPAFVYDLAGLREHAGRVRAAFAAGPVEVFYAAKANADAPVLRALAPHVHGIEVSSGGELAHVRDVLPEAPLAFGGPGKTPAELAAAVAAGARIHVESPAELARLGALGEPVEVLLRANPPLAVADAALAMGGAATPFGMDETQLAACADLLRDTPSVRVRGLHAHLASGLDAPQLVKLAARLLDWGRDWCDRYGVAGPEFNLGGGMGVDYGDPGRLFDWAAYASGLGGLAGAGERLRIEPGRAVTAYCGFYVTTVLDLKPSHGEWFAVLQGGTHHLRTPVTKGHDQPFAVLPGGGDPHPGSRELPPPARHGAPVTLVGQLCTPKDVFARAVTAGRLEIGDTVVFAMSGAYAWNISHHDFLMHPKPAFHYVGG